jgi:hypothetical protein
MRELDRGDARALFCRIARDNTATPRTEPAFRHVDLCAAPVSRRRLWPIKPQSRDKLSLHPRSGTGRALIPRPSTLRHGLGRVNPRTFAHARCGRAVGHAKRATCRSESAPRSQTTLLLVVCGRPFGSTEGRRVVLCGSGATHGDPCMGMTGSVPFRERTATPAGSVRFTR